MTRLLNILLIALCGFGVAGARTIKVNTGDFHTLKVFDDLQVIYNADPQKAGTAEYECDERYADALMFTVNGTDLKIQVAPDFLGREDELPVIYVYSNRLQNVESSSTKKVEINRLPACPEFRAILMDNGSIDINNLEATKVVAKILSGHGTINISGKTPDAVLELTGTGTIRANNLIANKVSCHVFGTGEIFCTPLDEIKLKGLGTTRVYYTGNPAKVKKHGLGKLIHVGD